MKHERGHSESMPQECTGCAAVRAWCETEIAALKRLIGPLIRLDEKAKHQPGKGGIEGYRP